MRRLIPVLAALLIAVSVSPSLAAKSDKATAVALQGYCPVAYATMKVAMKGDARYSSVVKGHRYRFANADAKKMFDANPEKFQGLARGSRWLHAAVVQPRRAHH